VFDRIDPRSGQDVLQAGGDVATRDSRKRKPPCDFDALSSVLAEASDEFARTFSAISPGYPLPSLFGLDPTPRKMIRLQFEPQGPILQNSVSAENLSVIFSYSHFQLFPHQKKNF
jgi:hypothetical protein